MNRKTRKSVELVAGQLIDWKANEIAYLKGEYGEEGSVFEMLGDLAARDILQIAGEEEGRPILKIIDDEVERAAKKLSRPIPNKIYGVTS